MVLPVAFRRSSTPLIENETKLPAAPPFKGRSRNNSRAAVLNVTSLPPPATSNNASSSHQHPLASPEVDNPYCSVVQDAASSSHHNLINENDIVIAIMGVTGAGKSSFVDKAAGNTKDRIGHDLTSWTREVQPVRCTHPDGLGSIVLVDTPGFDDTNRSDAEILKALANWLKNTYQNNIKLAGILYLHRISDVRMAGTPLRNLTVFKDLCGNDSLKNIVLVTTMWDEVESQLGTKREEELVSSFWKDMMCLGSRTCRYRGTYDSAWEIINQLDLKGSLQKRAPLQIQREMVDRGLPLHETTAAKTLFRFLVEEFKRIWAKIRGRARRPIRTGQPISPRQPAAGLRQTISRLSLTSSSSSQASWSPIVSSSSQATQSPIVSSSPEDSRSVISLTSFASSISSRLSGVANSTASGCSVIGRREALSAMTRGLTIVHEAAEIVPVPMLREAIGTVLCIAKLIEEINGTHHAISEVVHNSGWLLEEVTQYAMKSQLSEDIKRALSSFRGELENLQNIVTKLENGGSVACFLLHDTDIEAIAVCNDSIKTIYVKLGVNFAMENAIARLEDEMTLLRNNRELRECRCGSWVVREEEVLNAANRTSVS